MVAVEAVVGGATTSISDRSPVNVLLRPHVLSDDSVTHHYSPRLLHHCSRLLTTNVYGGTPHTNNNMVSPCVFFFPCHSRIIRSEARSTSYLSHTEHKVYFGFLPHSVNTRKCCWNHHTHKSISMNCQAQRLSTTQINTKTGCCCFCCCCC